MIEQNYTTEEQLRHFEDTCREKGIKLTQQRREIFRELIEAYDHPNSEQIFQRVRKRVPAVSLDTVYRTLWLFNDLGLVQTLGSTGEGTRFDANLTKHHHFVCQQCGLTRDFYSEELNTITLPSSLDELGKIVGTHMEVRGICNACLLRQKE